MASYDEDTSDIDAIISGMQQWSPEERSRYCDDIQDHPLFMGRSPTLAEAESNPYMSALANINYDEVDTPQALAAEAKDKGNAAFAKGPAYYGHAIKYYNEAIDHAYKASTSSAAEGGSAKAKALAADMRALQSAAYANLAMIHLKRSKWISAIAAAEASMRAQPKPVNIKAAFRAGVACLELGRATAARDFAQLVLGVEPGNAAAAELRDKALSAIGIQERAAAAAKAAAEERERRLQAVREACNARGIRVGPPLHADARRTAAEPYWEAPDAETAAAAASRGQRDLGMVHWPLIVLYPEHGQSDFLEDVEEGAAVGDVVDLLLPNDGPPIPWDPRGDYRALNVDVFYKANSVKPLPIAECWKAGADRDASASDSYVPEGEAADAVGASWVRVPVAAPLATVLSAPDYVVPESCWMPTFTLVANECLLRACAEGDLYGVEDALRANASLMTKNQEGFMPIHLAVLSGNVDVVKRLIQARARVNAVADGRMGLNPLHAAVHGNFIDIASVLLRAAAHVDSRNPNGETALHVALMSSHPNHMDMVRLLLEHGADPSAATPGGLWPLHFAIAIERRTAVRMLLAAGASTAFESLVPEQSTLRYTLQQKLDGIALRLPPVAWSGSGMDTGPVHLASGYGGGGSTAASGATAGGLVKSLSGLNLGGFGPTSVMLPADQLSPEGSPAVPTPAAVAGPGAVPERVQVSSSGPGAQAGPVGPAAGNSHSSGVDQLAAARATIRLRERAVKRSGVLMEIAELLAAHGCGWEPEQVLEMTVQALKRGAIGEGGAPVRRVLAAGAWYRRRAVVAQWVARQPTLLSMRSDSLLTAASSNAATVFAHEAHRGAAAAIAPAVLATAAASVPPLVAIPVSFGAAPNSARPPSGGGSAGAGAGAAAGASASGWPTTAGAPVSASSHGTAAPSAGAASATAASNAYSRYSHSGSGTSTPPRENRSGSAAAAVGLSVPAGMTHSGPGSTGGSPLRNVVPPTVGTGSAAQVRLRSTRTSEGSEHNNPYTSGAGRDSDGSRTPGPFPSPVAGASTASLGGTGIGMYRRSSTGASASGHGSPTTVRQGSGTGGDEHNPLLRDRDDRGPAELFRRVRLPSTSAAERAAAMNP